MHIIKERPPFRVWERTRSGFVSRPWKKQELALYCQNVLNRKLTRADIYRCDIAREPLSNPSNPSNPKNPAHPGD